MPNWCNNELRVSGPASDMERFKKRAVGLNPWNSQGRPEQPSLLNFHSLVPVPVNLLNADYAEAGYEWEVKHWGAGWGACDVLIMDEDHEYIVYQFDTAWNPPVEFVHNVRELWPGLTFILVYGGPSIGFKGVCKGAGSHYEDHRITY